MYIYIYDLYMLYWFVPVWGEFYDSDIHWYPTWARQKKLNNLQIPFKIGFHTTAYLWFVGVLFNLHQALFLLKLVLTSRQKFAIHDLSRSFHDLSKFWFHDASRYGIHSKISDSSDFLGFRFLLGFRFARLLWAVDWWYWYDSLVLNIGILPEFTMTTASKRTPRPHGLCRKWPRARDERIHFT